MSELDKLEKYLKEHNIPYERIDDYEKVINRHQILVKDKDGDVIWDAICQRGSYGYVQGLLEIMGTLVRPEDGGSVKGWLTAEDIISRIEGRYGGNADEEYQKKIDRAIKSLMEETE